MPFSFFFVLSYDSLKGQTCSLMSPPHWFKWVCACVRVYLCVHVSACGCVSVCVIGLSASVLAVTYLWVLLNASPFFSPRRRGLSMETEGQNTTNIHTQTHTRKNYGVSPPKRPFSFLGGKLIQWKYCVAHQNLSCTVGIIYFLLFFLSFFFKPVFHFHCKAAFSLRVFFGLPPENINCVPRLFTSISVLSTLNRAPLPPARAALPSGRLTPSWLEMWLLL